VAPSGRLFFGAVCFAVALQPLPAFAYASPSPALDGVLAAPPAPDFLELAPSPGTIEGPFDAKGYIAMVGSADPVGAQKLLEFNGFLSGYGRSWRQSATKHLLVEAVLAFHGGLAASMYMQQAQANTPSQYQGPITVTGIQQYFGWRLWDDTLHLHADYFIFVKGNDAFIVTVVSPVDDIGDIASTQAQKQNDFAPFFTISPATWPELNFSKPTFTPGMLLAYGVGAVLVMGLILVLVVVLVVRSRRPTPINAAFAGALPTAAVQLSPDRNFWWNGMTWRDAALEVPPEAQRSSDGHLWWDGFNWRPVPGGAS
jgi:hypothetical protein